jgi:Protein of unknown function (DUF4239)
MTLYLVNHFSTLGLIALIVGGTTVVAIIASAVIHKMLPNLADSGFEEQTGILRADVFALLYTIILALVITDLSGNFSAASSIVSSEATALAGLTRAVDSFPDSAREPIRDSIGEYAHAVVEDEWPMLRRGEPSPRVFAALEGLYTSVRSFEPQTSVEQAFYTSAVDDLRTITLNRRQRVQQSQDSLSPLLRILLVAGGVVFIILAYPASVRRLYTRMIIVGGAAAFVSFAYLLTIVLDYPYSGDISVDTAPYKKGALARYWTNESPPRPLVPGTFERLSPQNLIGVWNSDSSYGEAVFRQVGDEFRGTYRSDKGTVVGTLSPDGVFHGWWCQEESRNPPKDAGEVEWRLLKTQQAQPTTIDGRWRHGAADPFQGGWDLTKIKGKTEPPDLAARFDDASSFCHHP